MAEPDLGTASRMREHPMLERSRSKSVSRRVPNKKSIRRCLNKNRLLFKASRLMKGARFPRHKLLIDKLAQEISSTELTRLLREKEKVY